MLTLFQNLIGQWVTYIKLGLLAAVAALIGYLFVVNANLRTSTAEAVDRQHQAEGQTAEWKGAAQTAQSSTDMVLDEIHKTQAALGDLALGQEASRADVQKLSDTLAKHDLEKLSHAKPALVERIINRSSAHAIQLLNASGSPANGDKNRTSPDDKAGSSFAPAPDNTPTVDSPVTEGLAPLVISPPRGKGR